MTLSNAILTKTIPEAAPTANTLNKILALTDTSSDVAQISLGLESLGFWIKHILGDGATFELSEIQSLIYSENPQSFNEITAYTKGIGLVAVGARGSPQPLEEGTLLSFGGAGKKFQLLAFRSGTIWFKLNEDRRGVYSDWRKINAGLLGHNFYVHQSNNATSRRVQIYTVTIPEQAQSVQVTLWGAGGGGGSGNRPVGRSTINSPSSIVPVYVGEAARESQVQYFVNNSAVFTLRASGGRAGNGRSVSASTVQESSAIPDARSPNTNPTTYSIPGRGSPGGISEKSVQFKGNTDQTIVIPQDGLAGELSVGSFDVTGPGQLTITLAPGGRNAGYNGTNFRLNQYGYTGKAAACEVIIF